MLTVDPSAIPPVIFNSAELAAIFDTKDPPVIAAMKKVLSTDTEENTILRIYLSRSDSTFEVIPPPDTLFAICQIKMATAQVVIECLLSKDYEPLEPVWYTEYCEQMIDKRRALIHREIMFLVKLL